MAYDSASRKDWHAARKALLETKSEYKGSNAMSSDFGGIPDQASYQAAICLIAEGKKEEGRAELVSFMKSDPLSPLVSAASRRIERLDGKPNPEIQALLQYDIAQQEKRVRFETSVCGPKCVEHLLAKGQLKSLDGKFHDYKEIAALCGTTDRGTTIAQLESGLKKIGIPSYAYMLNARDLARAPIPAVLLEQGHFLVLESRSDTNISYYDPKLSKTVDGKIPDDDKFEVPVLLFTQPNFR